MDSFVEMKDVEVLRERADMAGAGPHAAFMAIESRLTSTKGRKFYGTFRMLDTGPEYYACVERQPTDDPVTMQLEPGRIPGGLYARRKLDDWEKHLSELPSLFMDLSRTHDRDPGRPSVEFYRSRRELHLLLPVLSRTERGGRKD